MSPNKIFQLETLKQTCEMCVSEKDVSLLVTWTEGVGVGQCNTKTV